MPLFAHENESITRYFSSYKVQQPKKYNDFYWLAEINKFFGEVNILDIGSNYGQDLLLLAKYKQINDIAGEIVGYEPGSRPFNLLKHTFHENGFDAHFVHCALGAKNGSLILNGKIGNSEDMRIVDHSSPDTCEVVEVRTLDDEIRRLNLEAKPIYAKVDTQGAEWLVFLGGSNLLNKANIVVKTEFTPKMTFGISGENLLEFYMEKFHVIDERTGSQITNDNCLGFCEKVANSYSMAYTDFYLIPKNSLLVGSI